MYLANHGQMAWTCALSQGWNAAPYWLALGGQRGR